MYVHIFCGKQDHVHSADLLCLYTLFAVYQVQASCLLQKVHRNLDTTLVFFNVQLFKDDIYSETVRIKIIFFSYLPKGVNCLEHPTTCSQPDPVLLLVWIFYFLLLVIQQNTTRCNSMFDLWQVTVGRKGVDEGEYELQFQNCDISIYLGFGKSFCVGRSGTSNKLYYWHSVASVSHQTKTLPMCHKDQTLPVHSQQQRLVTDLSQKTLLSLKDYFTAAHTLLNNWERNTTYVFARIFLKLNFQSFQQDAVCDTLALVICTVSHGSSRHRSDRRVQKLNELFKCSYIIISHACIWIQNSKLVNTYNTLCLCSLASVL